MRYSAAILPFLPGLASAWAVPALGGFNTIWQDAFEGSAGAGPSGQWNIAQE